MTPSLRPVSTRRTTASLVRRTITSVVLVIAGLSFAFGFGNGWTLGLQLGVPQWIAPLIAPAVDLSVVSLIVSIQYVRAQGIAGRLIGPRLLLMFSGLVTFVINTARALLERQYGRAAFDAVAPLLLIFWGEVGPGLLALLHGSAVNTQDEFGTTNELVHAVPDDQRTVRETSGPSPELITRARELDSARRAATGQPISRDRMRAALGVSNALAGELVRIVRSAQDGEAG
jgi:hypothetical protein